MRQWLGVAKAALGWLYPERCELCGRIGRPAICADCLQELSRQERPVERSVVGSPLDLTACIYAFDGRAARAVRNLKYRRATALATPMAQLVQEAYVTIGLPEFDAVVPVPIHWTRAYRRGFNQSELLCEALPRELVFPRYLTRVRSTRPQVGLSREERLTNLRGAFRADPACAGLSVLLVDDVVTTGGTATACAEALKEAGARYAGILAFCGESVED
ncbi:MAG: ComF family protein [Armatimonadetes bacterium]|nr:ComF family protein [Armatimonadota bacterium]